VDIANERTEFPDKVDLKVGVEEQSTGELTFGAGFSSTEGALGDVSITERNLLGNGQYMKLNFTLASARQEIDLSFTEPYFMGRNFSAGFDIFNIITDSATSSTNLAFDSETSGITLRGSYPLTEYIRHAVRYTYRSDDISNPDPLASLFVQQQVGERITSSIGQTISYDNLDNRFLPKNGIFASISQDFAGIGGDVEYLRHEARFSFFTTISEEMPDWVLKLASRGGNVFGLGDDDVRINDRFFIGGSTLRGFDNQGIGPRDRVTGDPLGGNSYATTTAELMFPLGLPEELQIKGAIFTEAGTLFDIDDTDPTLQIQDEESIRASAGVGVFWRSPVGPIRIDFANAFAKEDFDETEVVRFSFGTRF
jgi:outer membrane protein insertion porin family